MCINISIEMNLVKTNMTQQGSVKFVYSVSLVLFNVGRMVGSMMNDIVTRLIVQEVLFQ